MSVRCCKSNGCVHFRDDDGHTPLHYPNKETQNGEEIVALLVGNGADINAQNNEGRTPVDEMLQNGLEDLAELLRRHGGVARSTPFG